MRDAEAKTIRLSEYRPPDYLIDDIALVFTLDPENTIVAASSSVRRNGTGPAPLVLNGARLCLESVAIDGEPLDPSRYEVTEDALTLIDPPAAFRLDIVTRINPGANTHLEGLYMSGGRFCTQCEAEGFRAITYFLDRPDVLARYAVRIEADKAKYPTLLANGNMTESGGLDGGRHYAVWVDPFLKPSYLFALVAGAFESIHDRFTTKSGREVVLGIYVDPGDAERARYAMDALKRSMKWDEEVFQREYDLDLFNIVAVRDFNFGAMENKGLNIFNSSLILADAETATDADFEAIEAVVGHEYFLSQLDRQSHHLPRLVPALPQGRFDGLSRARILRRSALARRAAHQGREAPTRAAVPGRCGPARPPRAAGEVSEDRQLLHSDRLRKGRRGHSHAQAPDWRRCFRTRHATLFRAPRRHSLDCRRLHRLFRRSLGPRSQRFHGLVRSSRHANAERARRL
jgi:hypothetical protein